jgi:GDP-mannose 6-dehydrogenase
MIRRTGRRRVGVLGLSFKPGTDDLRDSPMVALTEALVGKGYRVRIFDAEVSLARIHGANRRYIEHTIPHLSSLMVASAEEVVDDSEVVVVGKHRPEFAELVRQRAGERRIVDLVRLSPEAPGWRDGYDGICW